MAKQRPQRGTPDAAPPHPLPPQTPFWRVVTLPTLGALAIVASVWFYTYSAEEADRSAAEAGIVDAFEKARNGDGKSTLNLAPDPVFDDNPVSEAEADALQSHYILHRVREVVAIRRGEPGKGTKWLKTPHRYTLTTKVGVATPKVAVKVGDRVEAPSYLMITNPDIVIEVRDGKIHALRAEIHRE